jgi:hypothetical protein
MQCSVCHEQEVEAGDKGICHWCAVKQQFAAFSKQCGLERYPDPTGERYIFRLDGRIDGKKSECIGFMDDLWNALVRAKGGDKGLLLE